jgi:cell division protein FtsN
MGPGDEEIEEPGYGPDPEDPVTFDATEEAYGRGRLVLILAVIMVFAVIGIVYVAYQNGVRQGGRTSPPIITADRGPAKVEPEDPGGLVVEHQDKLVYDHVSGEESPQVEVLLPKSEEPVDLSGLRTSDAEEISDEGLGLTQVPPPVIDETADNAEDVVVTGTANDKPLEEALEDLILETSASEKVAEPPAKIVAAPPVTSASEASSATSGSYVVQVGAFEGSELASNAWERLLKKHGGVVGDLRPDIQLADLGDRGVWYRLRIGPFNTKADAQSLCNELKNRKQDCLVRPT